MSTTSILAEKGLSLIDDVSTVVTSLSLDVIIILVALAFFLVFALWRGKSRGISILLSVYLSGFILSVFPYWDLLIADISTNSAVIKLVVFGVIFVFLYSVLKAIVFANFPESIFLKWLEAFLLSIGTTALLLFNWHSVLADNTLYSFSPKITDILSSQVWFFWVLVLPLLVLYFMNRDEF